MIVVLAKREASGVEVYFKRGRKHGGIEVVAFWNDAQHFRDKPAALACANTHHELRDSEVWRAVEVTERCERTR